MSNRYDPIRDKLLVLVPRNGWIRFKKPIGPVDQEAVDAGVEWFQVARILQTDEICLMTTSPANATRRGDSGPCRWDLAGLLAGEAEVCNYGECWSPVGWSVTKGQLTVEDLKSAH